MAKTLLQDATDVGYSFWQKNFYQKINIVLLPLWRDDIDLNNFRETYGYISDKPDYIIHCASMSGGMNMLQTAPKLLVENWN